MKHLITYLLCVSFAFAASPIPFNPQIRTVVASGGGAFVSDSMTGSDGTDLTAHTGETGATWAKVTGVTGVIKITSNRCKGDSGTDSLYYASGTPATAEYDVEADLHVVSAIDNVGIVGRQSTSAHTGYRVWYEQNNSRWSLDAVSAGTPSNLGTFSQSLSVGVSYHIKLEIRDATKKVYIDGVERISSADNSITAAGRAGIWYQNSDWGFGTTGRAIDNFTATDL